MEPVTHFLTGACLARAGFNRKTAYATLAMTLAAEAPDIDVLFGLGGPVTGFCHHRGITHTFLGAPAMALLITGLVWLLDRLRKNRKPRAPIRWPWVFLLALLADGSHLFLDWTNNYGLRPLFPFNPHWYAGSFVFIFDPLLFAFLLFGLFMPALLGLVEGEMRRRIPGQLRGRAWALTALFAAGILWGIRAIEHRKAERLMAASAPGLTRIAASPSMVDPFTWHGLGETATDYRTAEVDSRSNRMDANETLAKPTVTPAVTAAKRSYLGRVYGDWSSWPVVEDLGPVPPPGLALVPENAHTVQFRDLRFTSAALGSIAEGRGAILSGWVVVAQDHNVLSQWMNDRPQR